MSNAKKNTPVTIWIDKENAVPVSIMINMSEAEQADRDRLTGESAALAQNPVKVKNSYIKIDIDAISNGALPAEPEGIPKMWTTT